MRLLLFGTGALASLLGARLARAGRHVVTLAGTWGEALARIASDGIEVRELDEAFVARPGTCRADGPLPEADVALVLVKAWQTGRVVPHLRRAVEEGAAPFTFQNGLAARDDLAAALDRDVGLGVVSVGALLEAPGVVRAAGPGRVALAAEGDLSAAAAKLARVLTEAGTPARVEADVRAALWRKLVANAAINALTALHGVRNGELLARPELRAQMEAAAREAGSVASALGIDLAADPAGLAASVIEATAGNRSSMLQDVERGGPTEVDVVNGAVVREARRLGLPAPVNERLWQAVLACSGAGAARP
jgi:2-dehydropantoate 2-reductase